MLWEKEQNQQLSHTYTWVQLIIKEYKCTGATTCSHVVMKLQSDKVGEYLKIINVWVANTADEKPL